MPKTPYSHDVSLVKSPNHKEGVINVLKNIEQTLIEKLKTVNQVVVKINFVKTAPELATTPFQAVEHFVDFITPHFSGEILIVEEASFGSTAEAFEMYGFKKLADQHPQVNLLELDKDQSIKKSFTYETVKNFDLKLSKTMAEAPLLVSITRPKTHDTVVVTLGIKNVLVGVIQGKIDMRRNIHKGKEINNIMAQIADYSYPDLVILDGTVGMEGNGPTGGTPIKAGWSIASFDALAADSLATYLMGFDVKDVGYFNLLRDKDFGLLYTKDKVHVIGENPSSVVKKFLPHDTFEEQRLWR